MPWNFQSYRKINRNGPGLSIPVGNKNLDT